MALSRRAGAVAATVLVVVCAFAIAFTQTAEAAWPGGNGKIVFTKVDFFAPSAQIYSMNSDGHGQKNLSAVDGGADQLDIQPSVSPDGKRIAFARLDPASGSGQIWIMKIDGTGQHNISMDGAIASESGPSWTEDGSKILFVKQPVGSFPAEGGSIWIRRADGKGSPRQVTLGSNDANPVMSPDGDRIAFSRSMGGPRHLFVMKADGNGTLKDLGLGAKSDWSPDSARLVYGQGGGGPIMVVKVSDPSSAHPLPGPGFEAPVWSPDGTKIAYIRCPSGPGSCQIGVMTATGANAQDITSDPSNQKPSWQSTGRGDQGQGGNGGH